MTLIDTERDDDAVMRAEDEAIRDADKPPEEPGEVVTGVPKLIEDLFGDTTALQQG